MVDHEPHASQYAEQVALNVVDAIDKVDATACTEILYKGDLVPELFLVVNVAREDRIVGSGSPGELAYSRVLAAMSQVRSMFDEGEQYLPKMRTLSAPDSGEKVIKGFRKEYRSIKL